MIERQQEAATVARETDRDRVGLQPEGAAGARTPAAEQAPEVLPLPKPSLFEAPDGRGAGPLRAANVLALQRTSGNQASQRVIERSRSVESRPSAPASALPSAAALSTQSESELSGEGTAQVAVDQAAALPIQRSVDGGSAAATADTGSTGGGNTGPGADPMNGQGAAPAGTGTTTITVTRATYTVTAKTLKEAAAQIEQRDEAGKTAWSPSFTVTQDDKGTVTDATVTVPVTVTMPSWAGAASLPPADKAKWDAFITALEAHEQGHVDIVRQKLGDAAKSLIGKTKAEADTAFKAAVDALQTASDEFDTQTDHGRNAGCTIDIEE